MKLVYNKKAEDPIYYIQKGYRIGNKTTTKTIARIGKHSELLKTTDNPLAYAQEKLNEMQAQEDENNKLPVQFDIDFELKVPCINEHTSQSTQLNIGYFYLQYIYNQLDLPAYFKKVTADRKITFDCNQINRFAVIDRILFPSSKLKSCLHLYRYYENPDIQYQHMLRFLDVLADNYDSYIEHLFKKSNSIVKRKTSVCYFDCSNFYFEIENEDEDYTDPVTGEVIKGFRKYGFSKEHRPNPIAEMGLFMDSDGIPISMVIDSGNTNEQTVAVPGEKKVLQMLENSKLIYCADAGLGSANIRLFNSLGGRSFIVTQSIKKLSEVLKSRVFDDTKYKLLSNNKDITISFLKSFDHHDESNLHFYKDKAYKVIAADSLIDLGLYEEKTTASGKKRKVKSKAPLEQYVIITFSRKYYEYQQFIRNKQIERAKKCLESPDPEEIKKGPNDVKRFLKRVSSTKSGEAVTTTYILDTDKISEEEKYDGYYGIATNIELIDDKGEPIASEVHHVLDIMDSRNLIEDCFRILKSYFHTRPIFLSTVNHIKGHFLICYTALLVYRLLEKKLNSDEVHFTTTEIIETLQVMNIADSKGLYYMSLYNKGEVLKALEKLTNLQLDRMYYLPKTLNKTIRNIR